MFESQALYDLAVSISPIIVFYFLSMFIIKKTVQNDVVYLRNQGYAESQIKTMVGHNEYYKLTKNEK